MGGGFHCLRRFSISFFFFALVTDDQCHAKIAGMFKAVTRPRMVARFFLVWDQSHSMCRSSVAQSYRQSPGGVIMSHKEGIADL